MTADRCFVCCCFSLRLHFIALLDCMGVSKWSRDSATAVAIAALAVARSIEKNVVLPISLHPRKRNRSVDSSRPPRRLRRRTRSTVADVYDCLGSQYFRRAYRMSYESFLKLNEELREGIQKAYREHNEQKNMKKKKKGREKMSKVAKNFFDGVMGERNYKLPPVPNGAIDSSIRLACALCYFAGGSLCNSSAARTRSRLSSDMLAVMGSHFSLSTIHWTRTSVSMLSTI